MTITERLTAAADERTAERLRGLLADGRVKPAAEILEVLVAHRYPVPAYSVYDGDTVRVAADLGFRLYHRVSVRVAGVDTPELRKEQLAAARVTRRAVAYWLHRPGEPLFLESHSLDKYAGRIVGDLCYGSESLAAFLLSEGLAKPYDGGRKPDWTPTELAAIEAMGARWPEAGVVYAVGSVVP